MSRNIQTFCLRAKRRIGKRGIVSVLFYNNMRGRDLRKAKNRERMSGEFRKGSGNEMYCAILTVIETLKKRKMGLIENLEKLFIGTPAIF